ncbi:ImmA/IrrE family metallo-endopeptidase [Bombiscardovia coagulans]|uniref:Toxin-antitoxin system toxin component n=1 Tax=Bombiscardovia coagulans TaxID=686666 RepID=A0A261ESJ6_9BIFI|nr:ImmA/IrrE family metallo-endopeptidase [Bombiscardovia coagulans]OZG49818.1 toxin-antitoxin system toxin component [Bombiscardovia coagulans]
MTDTLRNATKESVDAVAGGTVIPVSDSTQPEDAAIKTLLATVTDSQRHVKLPIRVGDIAHSLGLIVQSLPLPTELDGMLIKDKPQQPFKAVSNCYQAEVRQRFTLAHELGHYIRQYQEWPSDEITVEPEHRDRNSSKGFDPNEIWSNRFAAALLMPAAIVRKYWSEGKTDEQMARIFDVSESDMSFRRVNLGLR